MIFGEKLNVGVVGMAAGWITEGDPIHAMRGGAGVNATKPDHASQNKQANAGNAGDGAGVSTTSGVSQATQQLAPGDKTSTPEDV